KSTRETIVEAEMKNLEDAAQVLTQTVPRGRITKGAALSILGRMALYNEDWDKAIAVYQEVMGLGYTLDDDYTTLFTEAGETSNEIIFAVRFAAPGLSEGSHYNGHWNAPMEAINGTLDFANAFYATDGKPFNES